MATFPKITVQHLLDTYLSFPDGIRQDLGASSFTIALSVVKYYLGEDWLETHLSPLVSRPGFMRLQLADPAELQNAKRIYIQSFKTVDLGELLFNLQEVDGFCECITRMKTERFVETGLAELDFARMLYINDQKFRFIEPKGKRGDNYDFEITLGKWTVCADVKCKLEDKDISKSIIKNELSNSRDQLPRNRPGMFFIKVPQHWTETYLYDQMLVEAAKEFLRSTGRVVSVKYYIAPYEVRNGHLGQGHFFKEIDNPPNRFDANRSWELFPYRPPAGATDALPLKWRRFYDFPDRFLKI